MEVLYKTHPFRLEATPGNPMAGRLLLDHEQQMLLIALLDAEDESWALDSNGERLPADQLFLLSPWSVLTQNGPCKLLCRFINPQDGAVIFNTAESYPGDTATWARSQAGDWLHAGRVAQ